MSRAHRLRVLSIVVAGLLLAVTGAIATDEKGEKEEAPEEPTNTLRWTTASEVDNFGFDVFRGDSEEGPFKRLNEDPIPGAGTTDTPTKYKYVDDTIAPDRSYYYYVESISMSGERKRFTPIIHAPPKQEKK